MCVTNSCCLPLTSTLWKENTMEPATNIVQDIFFGIQQKKGVWNNLTVSKLSFFLWTIPPWMSSKWLKKIYSTIANNYTLNIWCYYTKPLIAVLNDQCPAPASSVIKEIHLTINLGTATTSLRSWLSGSQSNVLPGWISVANCQWCLVILCMRQRVWYPVNKLFISLFAPDSLCV